MLHLFHKVTYNEGGRTDEEKKMRFQYIAEGAEYAVGDAYQWRLRFRRPLDFTARARVIEKGVLRATWKGETVRDGVKVHFLDPETGQPLTAEQTPRPTRVLASNLIQQDWAEFEAEHKDEAGGAV